MKKRFTEEQIVAIQCEAESGGKTVAQLARQHGVSEPTIYGWKRNKYGGIGSRRRSGGCVNWKRKTPGSTPPGRTRCRDRRPASSSKK